MVWKIRAHINQRCFLTEGSDLFDDKSYYLAHSWWLLPITAGEKTHLVGYHSSAENNSLLSHSNSIAWVPMDLSKVMLLKAVAMTHHGS